MNKKIIFIVMGIFVLLIGSLFILKAEGIPYYKLLSGKLNGVISAVGESNPEVTRTASTQTVCNDGKCTLTLYSGIRYAYEDEIWKEVEKARSLKDSWDVVYLKDDGDHKIDVLDYNYTSITLDFSFIGDAEEYEYEVEEGKIKIKFKIIETKFNETSFEPYEEEIEYEIEIEEDEKESFVYSGNPLGKKFKFGEHSTTIMLQDADTENLDDAWMGANSGDKNFGKNLDLTIGWFSSSSERRSYLKFNISSIPSSQQIDSATLYIYVDFSIGSQPYNYSLYNLLINNWTEGSGNNLDVSGQDYTTNISWNNQPCGTAFDDNMECNLTPVSTTEYDTTTSVWRSFIATDSVSYHYENSNLNVSFVIKTKEDWIGQGYNVGHSKEATAGITLRPYLNITYTSTEVPVVNLDSPPNNTITSTLTQYFNASYTGLAGNLVNATLFIWNSTDLVYNVTNISTGSSNASSMNFTFTLDDVYEWNYYVCDDSVLCGWADSNFTLTIDTTPPTFTNLINLSADANSSFSYDIDATDVTSSVDCFTVNDTDFQIDCDGVLQNNTVLSTGTYWLNITVNDTANNLNSGIIYVNVTVWDTILKWDWGALMTDRKSPDQICFVYRNGEYCFDVTGRIRLVGNATIERVDANTSTWISKSGNLITKFGIFIGLII